MPVFSTRSVKDEKKAISTDHNMPLIERNRKKLLTIVVHESAS